jgi:hypothetical protein
MVLLTAAFVVETPTRGRVGERAPDAEAGAG